MLQNSLALSDTERDDAVPRIEPVVFEGLGESHEDWRKAMRGVFVYGPALSLGLYGAIGAVAWFVLW